MGSGLELSVYDKFPSPKEAHIEVSPPQGKITINRFHHHLVVVIH